MSGRVVLAGILVFTSMTSAFGSEEIEKSFSNSIGIRFARIEAGSFLMGQKKGGDWDEVGVHKVNITEPFYIAITEVTNAQYEQFDPEHSKLRGKLGFSMEDDEAVVFVSWHEAVRFCEWLSKKEDKAYRLPTEAEWEYACRAGTTTAYHTGEALPDVYHKHQKEVWQPVPVSLHVGRTPANPWGLHDMHGNIEEWCYDWYGPYESGEQQDPVGCEDGDFRVTRGGSHSTEIYHIRSANRMGTLPEDKHWLIGFRVVMGELPKTRPLPKVAALRWANGVSQSHHHWSDGPDLNEPYFKGPRQYVKIPPNSNGPMFSEHNHQPALAACPNGDLLAIWYTTKDESGRELAVVAARLRRGSDEWEPASPFWDAPGRNDHGSAIWWDGKETIYHFNGLSTDATWAKLALVMRTSSDNGATWSKARLINVNHSLHNQVIAGAFQTREGYIIVPCDAAPGGIGGTAIHISRDGGKRWVDPGAGRPNPKFTAGGTGAWIAGIHAGVVQLQDGSLMALGRGNDINGQMPKSVSADMGKSWTYSASRLPPISGGQRLVLLRLREGPLMLVSFTDSSKNRRNPKWPCVDGMVVRDAAGKELRVYGLFAALSFDEGETWPVRRLITDDGPSRRLDGGGNTGWFTLSRTTAEPGGYLACTQSPDGVVHLITSKQHYAFNLTWLKTPMPAENEER